MKQTNPRLYVNGMHGINICLKTQSSQTFVNDLYCIGVMSMETVFQVAKG